MKKQKKEVEVVPAQMSVMQPTVINQSNPVDLNYLYLVLSKEPADFGFPHMTELMNEVTKLGQAFMEDKQPGSGMYAKAEVDLRATDLLIHAIKLVIARKIDLGIIAKRVLFPMKPVTTVGDMDPDTKHKIIEAVNEHFPVDFSDGMDPKLAERIIHTSKGDFLFKSILGFDTEQGAILKSNIKFTPTTKDSYDGEKFPKGFMVDEPGQMKQYPMRPEEDLNPEDVIDNE